MSAATPAIKTTIAGGLHKPSWRAPDDHAA